MRNPLYHWTHLESKNPFCITNILLCPKTADTIYARCSEMLLQQVDFSTRGLHKQMNVKVVCTTDDPLDSLEHHRQIRDDKTFSVKVLPAFRPDRAMAIEDPAAFNQWVDRLAALTDRDITTYEQFMDSLRQRHSFFHEMGCRLSDHGLEEPYADKHTDVEVAEIFSNVRFGRDPGPAKIRAFKSSMLIACAVMDHERGWTQNAVNYFGIDPEAG